MRLLMVADGRSPITRNWIKMLQPLGLEITLVSTFPCIEFEGVKATHVLPVAFAGLGGSQAGSSGGRKPGGLVARFRRLAAEVRHQVGPWTIPSYIPRYLEVIEDVKPDLVHALRIPYEGMLASATPAGIPLVVSTWGNDLTLHAPTTHKMGALTRSTLRRADGLMSDVRRDAGLAAQWGFDGLKPTLVVPGNGGIDLDTILNSAAGVTRAHPPQVLNPRGLRSYVRSDTFFKSIPMVLKKRPEVRFRCTSMAGQPEAEKWVRALGIEKQIRLLPLLSQAELWREFSAASLSVSVSTHDGTPNTLLEAMSLGCLPVCGDLDSIREWIEPGINGLLIDPADPAGLADAILRGLEDKALRDRAMQVNRNLVRERAEISSVREKVAEFYKNLSAN